ncbi:MAG: hypothetical protein F2667_04570 [Actinobacteria bacterium]|uniref:Unannotated protein n=1 Tax=freshwater metagenome TaxID=449393 RepID=A0A6J6PRK2_9ZZZZ|nr:hypothetical protein [Actinomycetota bacterium]
MFDSHVLGGFSIDAVRYADGAYDVDRLGGNAFWATLGACLAGATPAVHAVVGADYPEQALGDLASCGVDVRGIRRRDDLPSTRVSFAYEPGGGRSHPADPARLVDLPQADRDRFLDNTDRSDLLLATLPAADDLDRGGTPSAWHLGLLPAQRLRELVDVLVDTTSPAAHLQLDCPDRSELRREGCTVLLDVLPRVDLFLPSTSDAAIFLPGLGPDDLVATFHDWGARAVVLKCGEQGAVVSDGAQRWHVPVYRDSREFDPTGAGDVFGGACLAVLAGGGDLVAAAVAGAAAASFATAVRSPMDLAGIDPTDYETRRAQIASGVEAA